jgi:hypothetical protein
VVERAQDEQIPRREEHARPCGCVSAVVAKGQGQAAGDVGGEEHGDHQRVTRHDEGDGRRLAAQDPEPTADRAQLEQGQRQKEVGLQDEADPAQDADEGRSHGPSASPAKPQRDEREIGESQHHEEVLPLAELGAWSESQHHDQERRGGEPVGKEGRIAAEERSRHPGAQHDQGRRRDVVRGEGGQSDPFRQRRGQGGHKDDQRRVDLDEINVQSLAVQDPLSHVDEPSHVVLGALRHEDQHADRHDDGRGDPPSA